MDEKSLLRKIKVIQVINIIGFLGMLIINALANILPIGGKGTGELSAQYPNLFVPAGYTFSIWGLIYLMLLCFTIYQARDLFSNSRKSEELHNKVGLFFFITCLLNIGWIFAWHYELVLFSVIIMLLLLDSLISLYLKLGIGKNDFTLIERLFVQIPFSLYLGWITIAIVANITAFLVNIGWSRFGLSEWFWFWLVILVCVIIEIIVFIKRKDVVFNLVAIWAFIGILVANLPS
ncbi:MAG: hypothetical protein K0B81_04845 [Candidatus Cloacimonetes bacterium]|nr:hypothetical protein [Candidatus Cloacimonadota bacterium]